MEAAGAHDEPGRVHVAGVPLRWRGMLVYGSMQKPTEPRGSAARLTPGVDVPDVDRLTVLECFFRSGGPRRGDVNVAPFGGQADVEVAQELLRNHGRIARAVGDLGELPGPIGEKRAIGLRHGCIDLAEVGLSI